MYFKIIQNGYLSALANVFTGVTCFPFLVFNLLCVPCFAAMGEIKREMNSAKWTAFANLYQCGFAYLIGMIIAILLIAGMLFLLFKPYKEADQLNEMVNILKN